MARLNNNHVESESDDEDMYTDPFRDSIDGPQEFSSPRTEVESGRSRSQTPFSEQENSGGRNQNGKRVRFDENDLKLPSMRTLSQRSKTQYGCSQQSQEDAATDDLFDPNQDQGERRKIRRVYRDLQRDVTDNKTEYLKDSKAIIKVFDDANQNFAKVKQTADATLDSRLLVTAADLATKRADSFNIGVKGSSLEVDDFITKSIRFLQKSKEHNQMGGQFDWAFMGRQATSVCCKRPPVKDFLNGPLAVQKKVRVVKQRRQRQARNPDDMVKPQELKVQDIAKNENSTMKNTHLIYKLIDDYMAENGLERLLYFRFVVNPESFGQTVENMFYTAFLVRDGRLAIQEDEETGLPYLVLADPPTPEYVKEHNLIRQQIVFSMDKKTWRELIKVFKITETIIPTREREIAAINQSGWYS